MDLGDVGPVWRSTLRHRAFGLLVLEVVVIFIIVGNLLVTSRWFVTRVQVPTGHRQTDLVEVLVRRPSSSGGTNPATVASQHQRELAALAALPGVAGVAPVSSTQGDDVMALPNLFWSEGSVPAGPSRCAGVERTPDGVVAGWAVEAGATLPEVIDLGFVEGGSFARLPPDERARAVIVTACFARALFGEDQALGRTVLSNRYAPARIVGVVDDVRMHVPFLPQTEVTAIFPGLADDGRQVRYLVRTAPGRAGVVRDAAAAVLATLLPPVGGLIDARLFASGGPRMVRNAHGTVKVFLVIGGGIGLAALMGNITLAALVVASRRRIIGIRRALGATRVDVFRTLWLESLIPGVLGTLLGLPITMFLIAQASIVFPGLRLTLADVGVTLVLVALVGVPANIVPALQATRVPPSEVGRTL
jgi:putative ABC transport system permease protein